MRANAIPKPVIAVVIALLTGAGFAALLDGGGPGSGAGSSDLRLVSNAVDVVSDAGSFRASFTMTGNAPGLPDGAFSMDGTGEFDQDAESAAMKMAMGVAGERLEFEIRLLGETMYMNMGAMGAEMGAPTPWLALDLSAIPGMADLFGSTGPGAMDPSQFLELLRGAGNAQADGQEVVRGVPTTHYRAQISLKDALQAAPSDRRAALEEMLSSAGSDALAAIAMPVEAWIDAAGLPRRIQMTMDLGGMDPVASQASSMVMTMEMFDFGADVNVQAPPANEVTDMSNMLGGGQF